ncbi:uncharacterized protein DFL_007105 [Arthrobotrys flagrans]|uniref:Uncharacterized protein n=1 Tax=Arthrobotrys flagrans TaxID=97331 RepID=A0A436ZUS6_ARTFL|nr:hypothetical protein DFL_007105 [Arthrobotrys flagrans]
MSTDNYEHLSSVLLRPDVEGPLKEGLTSSLDGESEPEPWTLIPVIIAIISQIAEDYVSQLIKADADTGTISSGELADVQILPLLQLLHILVQELSQSSGSTSESENLARALEEHVKKLSVIDCAQRQDLLDVLPLLERTKTIGAQPHPNPAREIVNALHILPGGGINGWKNGPGGMKNGGKPGIAPANPRPTIVTWIFTIFGMIPK